MILSMPAFVSCLIDDSDVNPVDAQDLKSYAKTRMADRVALPLEALELSLEFDEFLAMTPEEQQEDTVFFNHFLELSPGKYSISRTSSSEFRSLQCIVNTGGQSIRDKGTVWVFDQFMMTGNDFEYSYLDYCFSLPEDSELAMMSVDSTWVMTMGEDVVRMKQHPKQGCLYRWAVEARGSEETSIGISAEYGTRSALNVYERLLDSGDKINTYEGQFHVDIYRHGEPLDYCYVSFQPGSPASYHTSR